MASAFSASYQASPNAVGAVRRQIGALARSCQLDEDAIADVMLAVSEATSNAVLHGCESPGTGNIRVEAAVVDNELQIEIADDGGGLRPRTDSPGLGLGLSLMAALTQSLEIVDGSPGTHVRMTFPCPQPV